MITSGLYDFRNILGIELLQREVAHSAVIAMRTMPGQECFGFGITIGGRQFVRLGGGCDFIQRQLLPLLCIFDLPIIMMGRIVGDDWLCCKVSRLSLPG